MKFPTRDGPTCPHRRQHNGARDSVVPAVSWPGLARPSTAGGAETGEVVDGRHRHALGRAAGTARGAGHDTGGASPAMSAPVRLVRAIAIRTWRDRWPGRAGIGVKPSFRLANTTSH